jgi:hypothetical protein
MKMTIQLPKKTLGDWVLKLFGKKRAFSVPDDPYKRLGPYVCARASRESFWQALGRPKSKSPPPGWGYVD